MDAAVVSIDLNINGNFASLGEKEIFLLNFLLAEAECLVKTLPHCLLEEVLFRLLSTSLFCVWGTDSAWGCPRFSRFIISPFMCNRHQPLI